MKLNGFQVFSCMFAARSLLTIHILLSFICFVACEKPDLPRENFIEIIIDTLGKGNNQFIFSAEVKGFNKGPIDSFGFIVGYDKVPFIFNFDNIKTTGNSPEDTFTFFRDQVGIPPLAESKVRAYISSDRDYYSDPLTLNGVENVNIKTLPVGEYMGGKELILTGEISGLQESNIIADRYGICWSYENPDPRPETDDRLELQDGLQDSIFQFSFEYLEGEILYFRSYAYLDYQGQTGKLRLGMVQDFKENNLEFWTEIPFSRSDEGEGIILPRENAIAFSIDNTIYIGTGFDGNKYLDDFWAFDAGTNTWCRKDDFQGNPRSAAVAFTIGKKGYVGLGFDGNTFYDDFYVYDPVTDQWNKAPNFMGGPRRGAVGFSMVGGDSIERGYVGTGYAELQSSSKVYYRDFWAFEPSSNEWTMKADLPGCGREGASGFSINGNGFIGTGTGLANCIGTSIIRLDSFFRYDQMSNDWAAIEPYKGGEISDAVAFVIGNLGFVGLGRGNAAQPNSFYAYNPVSGLWEDRLSLEAVPRTFAVGASINDYGGFVFGGRQDNRLIYFNTFWRYDP